jgi:hypothetical protein
MKRIEEWVEELKKSDAYKSNPDPAFQGLEYDMKRLIDSMVASDLVISPHEGNTDGDDLSRIDPNFPFEKPSYLYDAGTILTTLISNSVAPGITPSRFLARINAMKQPAGSSDRYDAELSYGRSLEYMTRVENTLRVAAKQETDPNILSNSSRYPLFIWAVVINLKPDESGKPPEPQVPVLLTKEEESKQEQQGLDQPAQP